jgi:hypothetical protein
MPTWKRGERKSGRYPSGGERGRSDSSNKKQERRIKMEELPWGVKVVGLLACFGAVILLAAHDRLFKIFRRAPQSSKTK